jgi:hypothetical protein
MKFILGGYEIVNFLLKLLKVREALTTDSRRS